jgi:Protein kinase domain
MDFTPGHTLRQYISTYGPQDAPIIKALVTQLFSGIASIFTAGFAHLRICDETILVNHYGQLIIDNFQYAYPYGSEKIDNLYAAIEDKCGDDIYVAPEIFANIKYNARKAVIWSCGVLVASLFPHSSQSPSNTFH